DLLGRRLREGVGAHDERLSGRQGALPQDLDGVHLPGPQQPGADHGGRADLAALRKLSGQVAQVQHREGAAERALEAPLGNPAVERHLAALEAGPLAAAGAGLEALMPARGGLAVTGARTPADALPTLLRVRSRMEVAEIHASCSSSTRTA